MINFFRLETYLIALANAGEDYTIYNYLLHDEKLTVETPIPENSENEIQNSQDKSRIHYCTDGEYCHKTNRFKSLLLIIVSKSFVDTLLSLNGKRVPLEQDIPEKHMR